MCSELPDPVFTEAVGVLEMIARNPNEKRFYDARLKMQRDEQARLDAAEAIGEARGQAIGEARGKAIGEERGALIGRVEILQSLVGDVQHSFDQLRALSTEELAEVEVLLQQRLRDRD
ncbi:hypothetical protein [Rhodopirellula sp. MGV]|uniref:hypothetical protein n=1 Tax=Rhodopirellula sp. MGV TaxID=2023130 RepID=UPI001304C5F0|nr:hypothetical protein [Rhodopirellula sp. MGV]